jgi:hypothetical protein
MKIAILVVLAAFSALAVAECARDGIGEVFCSLEPQGGAAVDAIGTVRCGHGQCRVDNIGRVMCSKVSGGGAAVTGLGSVACYGGCEEGTSAACVRAQR